MKSIRKPLSLLIAALLLGAAAAGATACSKTDPNPPAVTGADATTAATDAEAPPVTEPVTDAVTAPAGEEDTDAVTTPETEEETQPEPEPAGFTVTVDGNTAHVVTPTGLSYDLTGYDSIDVSTAAVTYTQNLVVTLTSDVIAESDNRFTLNYESTQPLKLWVTYTEGGEEDLFYLEQGEHAFSAVSKSFIRKRALEGMTSLRLSTCTDQQTTFTLTDLSTEQVDVPSMKTNATVFLENPRLKLGISLNWGGAISHLEDKSCSVDGLTNLVNNFDEGRLIQQSYYGTFPFEGGYEADGHYDNRDWKYNPVQGGDQYKNKSRLVDFVISDNEIYVKSQPQDWALDNQITPSYMENRYILHEDYVEVKNRFTDFSGWEHPYGAQELPAFYTVSYLGDYVCYEGVRPWTGDELSYYHDLGFWGSSNEGEPIANTHYRKSNSETWCAWYNAQDDFGMGIYVPNIDTYLGGRLLYNGTKEANGGPCNYVSASRTVKLVSFESLEYDYLLATGSVAQIRETFTAHKDFSSNPDLNGDRFGKPQRYPDEVGDMISLDFSNQDTCTVLMGEHDEAEQAMKLVIDGNGADPQLMIDYTLAPSTYTAEDYSSIEITYMCPTSNSRETNFMELFLMTGDIKTATGGKSTGGTIYADGQYHTLTLNLSELSFWTGDIHAIRLDYFGAAVDGDTIYLKSIILK